MLGAQQDPVGAWVDGVESVDLRSERWSCAASGLMEVQVAPHTGALLQRDRVAVTVANDDVPKRLVHAQENARLYLTVPLEGRRLWNARRARTMLLNVLVFFFGRGTWADRFWCDPTSHRGDHMTRRLRTPR